MQLNTSRVVWFAFVSQTISEFFLYANIKIEMRRKSLGTKFVPYPLMAS